MEGVLDRTDEDHRHAGAIRVAGLKVPATSGRFPGGQDHDDIGPVKIGKIPCCGREGGIPVGPTNLTGSRPFGSTGVLVPPRDHRVPGRLQLVRDRRDLICAGKVGGDVDVHGAGILPLRCPGWNDGSVPTLGTPSHAPKDYSCPFCNYVAGGGDERVGPEHVVENANATLTYVSPKWWPNNPGNLLVIPAGHWESLYSLPDDLGAPILRATRRAALALKAAYRCDGVSTRQHNEPAGNQDVWHFHVHVFPRWENDGLYGAQGSWADRHEMTDRAALVREAIATLDD